jgi:hypothetical protein
MKGEQSPFFFLLNVSIQYSLYYIYIFSILLLFYRIQIEVKIDIIDKHLKVSELRDTKTTSK